jgi:hypothetical protein
MCVYALYSYCRDGKSVVSRFMCYIDVRACCRSDAYVMCYMSCRIDLSDNLYVVVVLSCRIVLSYCLPSY